MGHRWHRETTVRDVPPGLPCDCLLVRVRMSCLAGANGVRYEAIPPGYTARRGHKKPCLCAAPVMLKTRTGPGIIFSALIFWLLAWPWQLLSP